jgi:hypothetical protein
VIALYFDYFLSFFQKAFPIWILEYYSGHFWQYYPTTRTKHLNSSIFVGKPSIGNARHFGEVTKKNEEKSIHKTT